MIENTKAIEHPLRNSAIFLSVFFLSASTLLAQDISTWKTYRNKKYGYEIFYPQELELVLDKGTHWWEKDGRSFTIREPFSALFHELGFRINSKKKIAQILDETKRAPSLQQLNRGSVETCAEDREEYCNKWFKTMINGKEVVRHDYFYKPTGEILFSEFILDQVWIFYHGPSLLEGRLGGVKADEIISTFKFYK